MLQFSESGFLYYYLLGILLVATLIVSVIVAHKLQLITKIKQLFSGKSSGLYTAPFLERELERTSKLIEKAGKSNKEYQIQGLSLRKQLLTIEQDFLIEKGLQPSDLKAINYKLVSYLKCGSSASPTTDPKLSKNSDFQLKKLREQLELQKSITKELREKYLGKESSFDEIDALNKNNNITEVQTTLTEARVAFDKLAISDDPDANKRNASSYDRDTISHLISDIKQKYNHSLKEIGKLAENNNEKRKLILRLESELTKNQGAGEGLSDELVEKLKTQLRDSEMCTATLEYETEHLRQKLMELEEDDQVKAQLQQDISDSVAPPLHNENIDFDNMAGGEFSSALAQGLQDITDAATEKTVVECLLTTSKRLKLGATIYCKSKDEHIWLSADDNIIKDTKELIRSASDNKDRAWTDNHSGTIFKNGPLRYYLKDMFHSSSPEYLSQLASLLIAAAGNIKNFRLRAQSEERKEFLSSLTSRAKSSIDSLDEQNRYLAEEGKVIVDDFIENLNDFVGNLKMTEIQSDMYTDIEHEFKTRMELMFVAGSTMDEEFINLINLLDSEITNDESAKKASN
ncbi:hypothetical protein [Dasania marina]|uniref:hypothetical protein n=1 Tax=Dasania marina TaxID=471499 RepID=UPI0030D7B9E6|tara:strand:+ start:78029 stop:79747 length:1719 start_codon:yes stop_codon:yes gene_type:complete